MVALLSTITVVGWTLRLAQLDATHPAMTIAMTAACRPRLVARQATYEQHNAVVKRRLGYLEQQLLAYAQLRKVRELRTGDLTRPLGITAKQERELYSRLARAGLIAQVRRGLYLIPRELPLGGAWTPDEALALNTLMADRDGRYQICGPNAFNRYGFSDQIPNPVYAYNNRLSGERTIGAISLTLIKVSDARWSDDADPLARRRPRVAGPVDRTDRSPGRVQPASHREGLLLQRSARVPRCERTGVDLQGRHLPRQDPQRLLPAERGSGPQQFDPAERMTEVSDDIVSRNARTFA